MIRRPPRSTHCISSAASDVYKRQVSTQSTWDDQHQDMRNVWVVIPPKEYAHKNTIRFIDEYMTKVIVDLKSFSLIYDINDKLDFVKKFGMPTIPMEIKNNTENVSSSKLPDYSMNCLLYTSPSPRDQA
eukprot:TRINITY_DN7795_c0_g1_i3.p2 TRINITY_DN7795_c0_g1~~TRINITY_DN7795_c0_g1_i3.p2  ORF type:complete len:129 (-),score=43.10 TRINITY_DN7795_c0_g1_i3:95-481(-)